MAQRGTHGSPYSPQRGNGKDLLGKMKGGRVRNMRARGWEGWGQNGGAEGRIMKDIS